MDKLNFNRYAKNELLSALPQEKCCMNAWLSAAVKAIGSLNIIRQRTELIFETQDYDYVMSIVSCLKELYHIEVDIDVSTVNTGIQKGKLYTLKVSSGVTSDILRDTGVIYDTKDGYAFTEGVPSGIIKKQCCAKSYLKSLFVAAGAAGVPTKLIGEDEDISSSGSGYYLEFMLTDDVYAEAVKNLLLLFGITAKTVERNNKYVVYVKEGEAISNFFALTSASETVLYMQDIMVERMLNNNVNRKSNCEVANMDKIAIASTKQIIAINEIEEKYGLKRLTAELCELANLRLENPTASLDFFAEKQGVTKSCINHRFRKLISIAEDLRARQDGEEN